MADLNAANPALLRLMLQATIPDAADHIAERIDRTRAKGQWMESLDILFEPATPFLPVAEMLQRRFTVLTSAEGLVPELVQRETWQALAMGASMPSDDPSDRSGRWRQERAEALGAIAPFASFSRPIYTIRARVNSEGLPPLMRRVVLAYRQLPLVRADDLAIISWD